MIVRVVFFEDKSKQKKTLPSQAQDLFRMDNGHPHWGNKLQLGNVTSDKGKLGEVDFSGSKRAWPSDSATVARDL